MSRIPPTYGNLTISNLGPRLFPSPTLKRGYSPEGPAWHSDGDRILLNDHANVIEHATKFHNPLKSIELTGPRRESRRKVDAQGDLWRSVLESTGQPAKMGV